MKKSTLFQISITAIPIMLLLVIFWVGGMSDLVHHLFGLWGIISVFAFITFILAIIFFATKLKKKAVQPKTIANDLPANATVIRSYQSNMKISFGGVQKNYRLVIEVNVTNNQGETWSAKWKSLCP